MFSFNFAKQSDKPHEIYIFYHKCMAEILLFLLIDIYLFLVKWCFVSNIYVLYVTEINILCA